MLERGPELLQEMVRCIVNTVDPEKVVLFGSLAGEGAGSDSDVDLMVVEADDFDRLRPRRKELFKISQALRSFAFPIDILLYSHSEVESWKNVSSHIIHKALAGGRVLHEKPK